MGDVETLLLLRPLPLSFLLLSSADEDPWWPQWLTNSVAELFSIRDVRPLGQRTVFLKSVVDLRILRSCAVFPLSVVGVMSEAIASLGVKSKNNNNNNNVKLSNGKKQNQPPTPVRVLSVLFEWLYTVAINFVNSNPFQQQCRLSP